MVRQRAAGGRAPEAPERPGASILDRQTLILEDFPLPEYARALSPNGRCFWRTKNLVKLSVANEVGAALAGARLRPMHGPVRLLLRYVYPAPNRRDVDNLTTGVTKVVIDSLVRGKVLQADDSEHVIEVKAAAVVIKGQRRLEIVMEPAARPDEPTGEGYRSDVP